MTTPHTANIDPSVIRPVYNEANLLNAMHVALRGAAIETEYIKNIDYNTKGQREKIEYGNAVVTTYQYDRETFRLTNLKTTRNGLGFQSGERIVQNLSYIYDPAGNITHIQDDADIQNVIYFRNQRVEPSADYEYDAIYRLINATGREHLGLTGSQLNAPRQTDSDDSFHTLVPQRSDGNAMGRYLESYQYDEVGNILKMKHDSTAPATGSWTRSYDYEQGTNGVQISNRLMNTRPKGPTDLTFPYSYDPHGSMNSMPHLSVMEWDFKDQLHVTQQQVVNSGVGERTYYVYDAAGQRVRKVTERQAPAGQAPTRMKERIYLGGFEIYREYDSNSTVVDLERETLHIMDDKQRIALVETKTKDITVPANTLPETLIRYQFGNHLGSASLELEEQAQIISYEEYTPYGSTAYQAVRSQKETPKRYRYTGKERDEESGLYYHRARYYVPCLGRWSSCDPAGMLDGLNLYAYTKGNPIMRNDLTGTVSPSVIDHDIELRKEKEVLTYQDKEPPPKRPAEKTKPVHNVTKEHQEKVRSLINWAITSTANEDIAENHKLTKDETQILSDALVKITALRNSNIPDASDNLIYRDADHYLAARLQEWRVRGASELANLGVIDPREAMKLAQSGRSRENNRLAAGPFGANQLYENKKLKDFKLEALSGQRQSNFVATSDKAPSAAGATEWKLLGMIDYERYDVGNEFRKAVPHLVLDLPGKGERYSANPELPKYLRDEAERISKKMNEEARFTQ